MEIYTLSEHSGIPEIASISGVIALCCVNRTYLLPKLPLFLIIIDQSRILIGGHIFKNMICT